MADTAGGPNVLPPPQTPARRMTQAQMLAQANTAARQALQNLDDALGWLLAVPKVASTLTEPQRRQAADLRNVAVTARAHLAAALEGTPDGQ